LGEDNPLEGRFGGKVFANPFRVVWDGCKKIIELLGFTK
jgi:hypothetical protein